MWVAPKLGVDRFSRLDVYGYRQTVKQRDKPKMFIKTIQEVCTAHYAKQ